ncbi:MAG: hypothetical protein WBF06_08545 [Candidatus Acidiferrales bacterium]
MLQLKLRAREVLEDRLPRVREAAGTDVALELPERRWATLKHIYRSVFGIETSLRNFRLQYIASRIIEFNARVGHAGFLDKRLPNRQLKSKTVHGIAVTNFAGSAPRLALGENSE